MEGSGGRFGNDVACGGEMDSDVHGFGHSGNAERFAELRKRRRSGEEATYEEQHRDDGGEGG